MNRLELAQQLRRDSGISGEESTTIGATSGEWSDVVNWVDRAWRDIQNEHTNWQWMRATASFSTIAGQAEYPYASAPLSLSNFASWLPGTFRIYKNTIDNELILQQLDYRHFRDIYILGTTRATYGYPSAITVSPTKSLILALPPEDTSYTVLGDYQKTPTAMSLDTDSPDMPERFHMAIVYRGMMFAGFKESASELIQLGVTEYKKLIESLEFDQLPNVTIDRSFL